MTSVNPRAGWEKIGDQFYQKALIYESVFDQDLELENYLVVGAPFGGALGMCSSSSGNLIPDLLQRYGGMRVKSHATGQASHPSQQSTYIRHRAS